MPLKRVELYFINSRIRMMIILTGPSASGKTAVCLYLQEHFNIKKVVTHTTREKRVGEIDGVDYHFVSVDEFEKLKKEGYFIETVKFNNNYYGTSKKEVKFDKCLAVEFNGAQTYASLKNKEIVIFYLKLSEELRKKRMMSRGDPEEKINSRIINDREAFTLNEYITKIIDEEVDTEKLDIKESAEFIIKRYKEILKERKVK